MRHRATLTASLIPTSFARNTPAKFIWTSCRQGRCLGQTRRGLLDTVQRQITLGFLLEQLPKATNRVSIDDNWRDQLGVHRPVIDYNIDEYTCSGSWRCQSTRSFLRKSGRQGLHRFGQPAGNEGGVWRRSFPIHRCGTHHGNPWSGLSPRGIRLSTNFSNHRIIKIFTSRAVAACSAGVWEFRPPRR